MRTAQEMQIPTIGSAAPDFVYRTQDAGVRHLAELWRDSPALILWLRHLG